MTSSVSAEDLLRAAFKYHDALVSYAYGLLQDWALAQDAVQETFITVQKKHAEFTPGTNILAWTRRIARYEALNILRARGRETFVGDEELFALVDAQFEEHLNHDAVAVLEQQKAALHHCLAQLEPDVLQLLLGFYRDRVACERLAAVHRRSVNAIRLALSRIRSRLRDCVRLHLALAEVKP